MAVHENVRFASRRRSATLPEGDISVVIPTFDRPEFLLEAIASVRAQSLQPREILVIDNGRTPVAEGALPETTHVYRLPPGVGPSRARNLGAALAGGEFVAFLDDDDWWDSNFLLEARSAIASEKVRCVYGRKVESRADVLTPYKLASADELSSATLLRRNPGTGGMNLLIERQLFLRVGGFDDRLRLSEDRALALEVLLSGERIATAPRAIAVVRHHGANRLRQKHIRKLAFVWKYRRLYSPIGFGLAAGKILLRSLAGPLLPIGRKYGPTPGTGVGPNYTRSSVRS